MSEIEKHVVLETGPIIERHLKTIHEVSEQGIPLMVIIHFAVEQSIHDEVADMRPKDLQPDVMAQEFFEYYTNWMGHLGQTLDHDLIERLGQVVLELYHAVYRHRQLFLQIPGEGLALATVSPRQWVGQDLMIAASYWQPKWKGPVL